MQQRSFVAALDRVADASVPFTAADLEGLSNARRADYQLFAQRWPTIDVVRRRAIMRAMGELIEESFEVEFTPISRIALADTDSEVRAAAINNLWENEDPALIAPFLEFLARDQSVAVRAAAASALGKYVCLAEMEEIDAELGALLRGMLLGTIRRQDEDLDVRRRAVESIGFLTDDEVRGVIEDAYNTADERMQASAVYAMGRSLDAYWSGTVLMELHNPSIMVRLEAVRSSGELELRQAVPALVNLLIDPNQDIQLSAIHSLGQIGGPVAREALQLCAEDEDEVVAQAAEDALGELEFNSGDDFLTYDLAEGEVVDNSLHLDLDDFEILWQRGDDEFND